MKSIYQLFFNTAGRFALCILVFYFVSCKKFLTLNPPKTQVLDENVYEGAGTATSVITGLYSRMMSSSGFFAVPGIAVYCGRSSDELNNFSLAAADAEIYANSISVANSNIRQMWGQAYEYIYTCNAAIEGLNKTQTLSVTTKNQLLGEAEFMRAFCYFYLVNLFGDVPFIGTTDYRDNTVAARNDKGTIYSLIIADLLDAQSLLSNAYISGERVRPNKAAVTALLARVYLYKKDWANAAKEATAVIDNTTQYNLLSNLNDVFLKNSKETIWQLMPVGSNLNTPEAFSFIVSTNPTGITLSSQVANGFEPNDLRRVNWIHDTTILGKQHFYCYKYKVRSTTIQVEYSMVLRLAEQFLIRAEARTKLADYSGAQEDLNKIRERAGITASTASDEASLLSAIETERKSELFCEWGHRWLDLKRTNRANDVLGPLKAAWKTDAQLYPIPQIEILTNPNLTQNQGY